LPRVEIDKNSQAKILI